MEVEGRTVDNYFAALQARTLLHREITALQYRLASAKNPDAVQGKIIRLQGQMQRIAEAYPFR